MDKNNIILVTFDSHRTDYPTMSYSVASILATLKHYQIPASHYSCDIRNFKKTDKGKMPLEVVNDIQDIVSYLQKFSCVAIALTRWSMNFAYMIVRQLEESSFKGKIVIGGYEVTAMSKIPDWLEYFSINHFIQGYAEKALVKIMKGEYSKNQRLIHEDLDKDYLFSPYSTGVLTTYSRKVYWETKRGCTFNCGFCEWGNAQKDAIDLDSASIDRDIEVFSQSNIEEINILDATFNVQNDYLSILKKLVAKTDALITFQARFEALKPEFLQYCSKNRDRLHLEFGLQTIHKNEMEVIGRKNKMDKIRECIEELNHLGIDYEVSIIYAIPGQTVASFADTIEFLRINGCKKIMAFPLQIPQNSELERKSKEYEISYKEDVFYVKSVESSFSFDVVAREDMDFIADNLSLNSPVDWVSKPKLHKVEYTNFLYTLDDSDSIKNQQELSKQLLTAPNQLTLNDKSSNFLINIAHILNISKLTPQDLKAVVSGQKPLRFPDNDKGKPFYWETYYKFYIGKSGCSYIERKSEKKEQINLKGK